MPKAQTDKTRKRSASSRINTENGRNGTNKRCTNCSAGLPQSKTLRDICDYSMPGSPRPRGNLMNEMQGLIKALRVQAACDPLQKGMLSDLPHRHRVIRLRIS